MNKGSWRRKVTIDLGPDQAKILKVLVQRELQGGGLAPVTRRKLIGLLKKINECIRAYKEPEKEGEKPRRCIFVGAGNSTCDGYDENCGQYTPPEGPEKEVE